MESTELSTPHRRFVTLSYLFNELKDNWQILAAILSFSGLISSFFYFLYYNIISVDVMNLTDLAFINIENALLVIMLTAFFMLITEIVILIKDGVIFLFRKDKKRKAKFYLALSAVAAMIFLACIGLRSHSHLSEVFFRLISMLFFIGDLFNPQMLEQQPGALFTEFLALFICIYALWKLHRNANILTKSALVKNFHIVLLFVALNMLIGIQIAKSKDVHYLSYVTGPSPDSSFLRTYTGPYAKFTGENPDSCSNGTLIWSGDKTFVIRCNMTSYVYFAKSELMLTINACEPNTSTGKKLCPPALPAPTPPSNVNPAP